MAAFMYDKARQAFLTGTPAISWTSDTIKVALVKSTYVPNSSTDQYLSIISAGDIIATSTALANKTGTAGVAYADNPTFTAVTASLTVQAFVIYKDTGSSATSPLIVYVDDYTGLPLATTGGDITINFPTDTNKIFKL